MIPYLPFLLIAGPLCLIAAWTDLRTMTIPNWISISMIAAFVVLGLIFLPLADMGWRLLGAAVVFAIVFAMNALRLIGGGDAKLAAAFTPFIAPADYASFLIVLAIAGVVALVAHRIAARIPAVTSRTPDWVSWQAGKTFPYGVAICVAALYYLIVRAFILV